MAGCLVVLLVWRGLKSIFAGCLHGLGGSGFGVKSVFAGCLHGLATFWTGLSMFFCGFLGLVWRMVWKAIFAGCLVVLAGLASGLGVFFSASSVFPLSCSYIYTA